MHRQTSHEHFVQRRLAPVAPRHSAEWHLGQWHNKMTVNSLMCFFGYYRVNQQSTIILRIVMLRVVMLSVIWWRLYWVSFHFAFLSLCWVSLFCKFSCWVLWLVLCSWVPLCQYVECHYVKCCCTDCWGTAEIFENLLCLNQQHLPGPQL
jgi:hypothetical protein